MVPGGEMFALGEILVCPYEDDEEAIIAATAAVVVVVGVAAERTRVLILLMGSLVVGIPGCDEWRWCW